MIISFTSIKGSALISIFGAFCRRSFLIILESFLEKEAFTLFEGLLEKIKNDTIKLLLNLNIVVSSEEERFNKSNQNENSRKFSKVGRNDKCPCGSGKKFKFCHGNI